MGANFYHPILNIKETEIGIKLLKDFFQLHFSNTLNLTRVSAPLFVRQSSGLNDMLSGTEIPVYFKAPHVENQYLEIVHSLAKWKRCVLHEYEFSQGEGIYTDMNAIRREEILDQTHSLYVDQWDWEKIIDASERTTDYLQQQVKLIYHTLKSTEIYITDFFPQLGTPFLPETITFLHSDELKAMYPNTTSDERESIVAKKYGAVFIQAIGYPLKGQSEPHGMRSPDYDDWQLNGDIIVWDPTIGQALELSSMGIRVDHESMRRQLEHSHALDRLNFQYHQQVINQELPLSIGGGIGQSRICMLLLRKQHIGEVQASIWDEGTKRWAADNNIPLL